MTKKNNEILAGYQPAPLENWYRHNYFNNDFDISGSGVEEYSFREIQDIAKFSFNELDDSLIIDAETAGNEPLRLQVANLFGTGDADKVMVTNGANEALHLVVRSILKQGDEIITLGPCYHCHDRIAASMGCIIKKWQFSIENNFALDFDDLKKLISSETKALFLNFPHNPTGQSISPSTLDNIIDLARENNIYLVWDAVFQALVYDGNVLTDPIHNYEKAITLGTFSKAYGAPGLRFGWIVAPEEVIAASVRQKDYGNLFVAPVIEFVAEKMLIQLDKFSIPRLVQAKTNRALVHEWLQSETIGLSWIQPEGGVCGLIKLPDDLSDVEFCTQLLAQQGVLFVPGSCFGLPGFVRVGFGGNSDKLQEGMRRVTAFLRC